MATSKSSRIFASGNATTLYLTIPAQVVADSQFPFAADDDVDVAIVGDGLVVTGPEGRPG